MAKIYERLETAVLCQGLTRVWANELGGVLDLMEHNKFVKAFAEIQSIKEHLEEWAPDKFFEDDLEKLAEWQSEDNDD